MNRHPSVLFRCEASPEIGMGHLIRCLALADELDTAHGCQVSFAMNLDATGLALVRKEGYPLHTPGTSTGPLRDSWLEGVLREVDPEVLILDVRNGPSTELLSNARAQGRLIVTIDDPESKRLAADLAFYPGTPQAHRLDWSGFAGRLFAAPEWAILRRHFRANTAKCDHKPLRILITSGGSDPAGLALKAVRAVDRVKEDLEPALMLGAAFCHLGALQELLTGTRKDFRIHTDPADVAGLMSQSDLAVASFGVTAYELAALGVPTVYSCLSDDHSASASVLDSLGVGINTGVHTAAASQDLLTEKISLLVRDRRLRNRMSETATATFDALGASRIGNQIVSRLAQRGN